MPAKNEFQVFLTNTEFDFAYLTVWIDMDRDGNFQNNRVVSNHSLLVGQNTIDLNGWIFPSGEVYMRLMLHADDDYSKNYYGAVGPGEIEDYVITFEQPPQADLGVSLMADKEKVKAGDEVTITITASNAGPVAATGVCVDFDTAWGMTLLSSNPGSGSFNSGTWSGFDLGVNNSQTLVLVYRVDDAKDAWFYAYNIDSTGQADPNHSNNTAELEFSGQNPVRIGGEVQSTNKVSLLLPWLMLAACSFVFGISLIAGKTGSNKN